jgi:GDP-L-fucose synthase
VLESTIYVAGHNGLVGSALVRRLRAEGATRLLLRSRAELDLRSQPAVERFFAQHQPDYVFLAAAKVGGIEANRSQPAQFILENLEVQNHVIESAHRHGTKKLLFLGSSCIYPKHAPQPMPEECLLTGPLEPTNEWYAIAKIAGLKLCQAFRREYGFDAICAMPTNLYGPGDNFELTSSHVLPALLRKCHEARVNDAPRVELWGTGTARREFLHVDDLAEACVFLMREYSDEAPVNVGWGQDISIGELARLIASIVGYQGEIYCDLSKPDGTPRKLLDTSKLTALGWQPKISLRAGLAATYEWYLQSQGHLRQ